MRTLRHSLFALLLAAGATAAAAPAAAAYDTFPVHAWCSSTGPGTFQCFVQEQENVGAVSWLWRVDHNATFTSVPRLRTVTGTCTQGMSSGVTIDGHSRSTGKSANAYPFFWCS